MGRCHELLIRFIVAREPSYLDRFSSRPTTTGDAGSGLKHVRPEGGDIVSNSEEFVGTRRDTRTRDCCSETSVRGVLKF